MRDPQRPTFVDLFAGCGGLTRGFLDAGLDLVAGYEVALDAAATYAANFGIERTNWVDLTRVSEVPEVDVVIGGPPCQGFSNLGKRDPTDRRNQLWDTYVDFVVASGCGVFVFENVDRFAKSAEYMLLKSETCGGRLDGWQVRGLNLNAADFGVPQRRIRSIVIGSRVGDVGGPSHSHSKDSQPGTSPWRTVRDAIETLEYDIEDGPLPKRAFNLDGVTSPGAYKLQEIHVGRSYWDISRRRYSCIAPGRNRHDLPDELLMDCWRKHKTGAYDVLGRLEWDKPSVTIRTEFFKPEKGRYLHPEWHADGHQVNRAISHAEAALLQGFDDRHLWCGSKSSLARQIGNAVPPPMAEAIGVEILKALRREL